MWLDGLCNKCGSIVIEKPSNGSSVLIKEQESDYKNKCLSLLCEENHWHYVSDIEELDYYKHVTADKRDSLTNLFIVDFLVLHKQGSSEVLEYVEYKLKEEK